MAPSQITPGFTVRVEGLSSFLRAADASDRATKKLVRDKLRKAAEPVKRKASDLMEPINAASSSTYGISVRKVGTVTVEQRRRKTTGTRPDYGRLQMSHALYPALEQEEDTVVGLLERAVDEIADEFERRNA